MKTIVFEAIQKHRFIFPKAFGRFSLMAVEGVHRFEIKGIALRHILKIKIGVRFYRWRLGNKEDFDDSGFVFIAGNPASLSLILI